MIDENYVIVNKDESIIKSVKSSKEIYDRKKTTKLLCNVEEYKGNSFMSYLFNDDYLNKLISYSNDIKDILIECLPSKKETEFFLNEFGHVIIEAIIFISNESHGIFIH
mgnify:CR=1 FL=1